MASIPQGLYQQTGKQTWWLRWTPVPGGAQERQSLGTRDLAEAIVEAEKVRLREGPKLREAAGSCDAEIDRYIAAKAGEGLKVDNPAQANNRRPGRPLSGNKAPLTPFPLSPLPPFAGSNESRDSFEGWVRVFLLSFGTPHPRTTT